LLDSIDADDVYKKEQEDKKVNSKEYEINETSNKNNDEEPKVEEE